MVDFNNLQNYRENNRLEAKQATGGLPESIWETYSAFANTQGGVILLGVEELADKSLHAIDLLDPQWLIEDLWAGLEDPKVVSRNILTPNDVEIRVVDGKQIVVVTVPPASWDQRPIYIGGDPIRGTYHRSGEGDYRCTPEVVRAMLQENERCEC